MQSVVHADRPAASNTIRAVLIEPTDVHARAVASDVERSGVRLEYERVDDPEGFRQCLLTADWDLVVARAGLVTLSPSQALGMLKSSGLDIPLIVHTDASASDAQPKRGARLAATVDTGSVEDPQDHDELTGLATRARLMELAPVALRTCGATEQAIVCSVDLSHFGHVNTVFGYEAGDALLAQIGGRLQGYAKTGLAARFGADEFVVFQAGFGNEESMHRYVRELSRTLAQPYVHGDFEFHIATDVGVSVYPGGGQTLAELVLNADTALQQCKRLMGRDAHLFYFPELDPARGENILLDSALLQALSNNQLKLHYQPCVSLSTRRVTSVEALLRWEHPELGLLASERFIALAAECGLLGDIDAWVLREATRQGRAWRAEGHDFTIAINISAAEFARPRLLGRTAVALRDSGLPADALEIEITEAALIQDSAHALATLHALRDMGVQIAIDDFGTGYSSLAYLKRFPVDILKIDKSFVKNIALDAGDAAIAQSIIGLARNLGMTVQAEGVETQQQLDILAGQGCERAQGYFLARPVPAEELIPLVRRLQVRPTGADQQ